MQPQRFKATYGAWAVITGASDGIGREFARALAACEINLVLLARRKDVLQALAQELRSEHRVEVRVVAADLSAPDESEALVDATKHLDVGLLVAAAGYGTSGPFVDSSIDKELNMLSVNCSAVLAMVHHYGRIFKEKRKGGIIMMSSLVAFQGVPNASNYSATKAYIQSLAEGLHHELKPYGVDVLSVAPGPIRSGFGARANMTMSMNASPDVVARASLHALGRKMTVRPGFLSQMLELSLKTAPRWGRVRIMQKVMAGMTQG